MSRLLAALDKLPVDAQPTGQSSYRPPRQHRLPGLRAIATLLVWVLIIGGVVYLARLGNHKSSSASPTSSPSASARQSFGQDANNSSGRLEAGTGFPKPGTDEAPTRNLPAPPVPAGTGGYKFIAMTGSSPVTYDPCRPIHYVVREHDTPAGGDQTIRDAVAAVSKATGLEFIYDGTSDELPTSNRAVYQPVRYPNRWAPVLISWSDPKETPRLAGMVLGLGGSVSVSASGHSRAYVTGVVTLDAPQLTELGRRPDGAAIMREVVEHELGHLVGLAHVADPTQVMNPVEGDVFAYASGDLRGLAQLGRGSCHPEL